MCKLHLGKKKSEVFTLACNAFNCLDPACFLNVVFYFCPHLLSMCRPSWSAQDHPDHLCALNTPRSLLPQGPKCSPSQLSQSQYPHQTGICRTLPPYPRYSLSYISMFFPSTYNHIKSCRLHSDVLRILYTKESSGIYRSKHSTESCFIN